MKLFGYDLEKLFEQVVAKRWWPKAWWWLWMRSRDPVRRQEFQKEDQVKRETPEQEFDIDKTFLKCCFHFVVVISRNITKLIPSQILLISIVPHATMKRTLKEKCLCFLNGEIKCKQALHGHGESCWKNIESPTGIGHNSIWPLGGNKLTL